MCCTIQRNQRMLCVASKILLFFHGNISSFECAFYWEQYPMSRFRLCLFCQFLMFMLVGFWPFTVLPSHRTVWETESNGPCMLFVRFKRGDIRNLRLKWLNSPTPGAFQLNRHLPHTNYTKRPGLGNPRKRERVKENGKKSAASTFWLITKLFDWMYRFWWMGSRQETLIIFHVMTFNEPPSHSHILNEINECAVCSLFGRPLFHSHGTNMHEKVSIHCPYNFGHDKRQRCELIACVMQRHCNKTIFFHSVCLCVLANVASAKKAKVRRKWTLNKKRTILFQRFFCLLFFFLLLLFPFLPFFVVISVCVRDGVTCFVLCKMATISFFFLLPLPPRVHNCCWMERKIKMFSHIVREMTF